MLEAAAQRMMSNKIISQNYYNTVSISATSEVSLSDAELKS